MVFLSNPIQRRDFLRQAAVLGSLTATASLVPGAPVQLLCATGSETVEQQNKTRVALVKTRDRALGVSRVLGLLGINPVQGSKVVVKPNFNSADPAPGSTHSDVLRTLTRQLWQWGARQITVADRSGMGNTRNVFEQKGIFNLAQEVGFETQVFDELEATDWVMVNPPDSHWKRGFPISRMVLETETLIQTCCLKTHRYGGHFTLSLKNSVGLVAKQIPGTSYNYMHELHSSPYQRLMIAEINAAYKPALIVLDGVEAFVKGGPASGQRVWAEVVLAGTDRIAIDAVGVAILRHFGTTQEVGQGPLFQQEQIARAVELDLGIAKPAQIELVTDDPESAAYAAKIREQLMA